MSRPGFRAPGRRLDDGAAVAGRGNTTNLTAFVLGAALVVAAAAWCPSHDSFEKYLADASTHPSGLLGGLASVAERVRIATTASSQSYIALRVGTFKGRTFVGLCGTWVWVPLLPQLPRAGGGGGGGGAVMILPSICSNGSSSSPPHELFALLCVAGFILWQLAPRFCYRHAPCSLNALRRGKVWTLVTANLGHADPLHLLHNLMSILHLGPVVHSALGCENALALLAAAAIASSAASVIWHGVLGNRPGAGSVGASGVAMGLVAANAALFPNMRVHMYGVELSAAQVPLMYLLLDAVSTRGQRGDIDISAHAGGALAGWALAKRWKPWYVF